MILLKKTLLTMHMNTTFFKEQLTGLAIRESRMEPSRNFYLSL
jgi:hypothetical protein